MFDGQPQFIFGLEYRLSFLLEFANRVFVVDFVCGIRASQIFLGDDPSELSAKLVCSTLMLSPAPYES